VKQLRMGFTLSVLQVKTKWSLSFIEDGKLNLALQNLLQQRVWIMALRAGDLRSH
jgi:hypothetical protein